MLVCWVDAKRRRKVNALVYLHSGVRKFSFSIQIRIFARKFSFVLYCTASCGGGDVVFSAGAASAAAAVIATVFVCIFTISGGGG